MAEEPRLREADLVAANFPVGISGREPRDLKRQKHVGTFNSWLGSLETQH